MVANLSITVSVSISLIPTQALLPCKTQLANSTPRFMHSQSMPPFIQMQALSVALISESSLKLSLVFSTLEPFRDRSVQSDPPVNRGRRSSHLF